MPIEIQDGPAPPMRALMRGAKPIYPWRKLQPGQWFIFPSGYNPNTARTSAAYMGRSFGRHFRVYVSEDDERLICMRVDGLPDEVRWPKPTDRPMARARDMADAPQAVEGSESYEGAHPDDVI